MTLDDLERLSTETLTPAQAAEIIGIDRHTLTLAAKTAPERLGFPVIVLGAHEYARVKIPRRPFIAFMRGAGK